MGIDVQLVDEFGRVEESVGDPTNILHRLLPPADDPTAIHSAAIDWYGNTTFNYLQIPRFLDEWRAVENRATTESERQLLSAIRGLAEQVLEQRHTYLKFLGD